MDSTNIYNLKEELANRLRGFFRNRSACREPLFSVIDDLVSHQQHAFFFGGLLRDLMIHGPSVMPRDVDIVVSEITPSLLSAISSKIRRRTRFGGLNLESQGWMFDVWDISSTWAFREGAVDGSAFCDLPRTTFLNCQAVVAEVYPKKGRQRLIYSHGFFESIMSKTLDINCEDNPFPSLCVVQTLLTAAKLNFGMSRKLASYVTHHATRDGLEKLVEIQASHYRRIAANVDVLHKWMAAIREQIATGLALSITLPAVTLCQLPLPLASPLEAHPQVMIDQDDIRQVRMPVQGCLFDGIIPGRSPSRKLSLDK